MRTIKVNVFIDVFLNKKQVIEQIKEKERVKFSEMKPIDLILTSIFLNLIANMIYNNYVKSIKPIIIENITNKEMLEYMYSENMSEVRNEILLKLKDKTKKMDISL